MTGTNPNQHTDEEALVDTGFTGFLMLPVSKALPLGLVLDGAAVYTLADGSNLNCFGARGCFGRTCPRLGGSVSGEEKAQGAIVLGGDNTVVGMDFLRRLNKLLVTGKIVALLDHEIFEDWIKSLTQPLQPPTR